MELWILPDCSDFSTMSDAQRRLRLVVAVARMADRRILFAKINQPYLPPAGRPPLEQSSHCRLKTSAETQACLAIRMRRELAENHRDLFLFNIATDSMRKRKNTALKRERLEVRRS